MSQQYAAIPQAASDGQPAENAAVERVKRPYLSSHERMSSTGPESSTEVARQHGILPADRVEGVEQAVIDRDEAEKRKAVEEHEQIYAANRDMLISAIGETSTLVAQLKDFNREKWIVHYPELVGKDGSAIVPSSSSASRSSDSVPTRSSSSSEASSSSEHSERPQPMRSWTTPAQAKGDIDSARDMSVLRVDLKVGTATTPSALVHSLEKSAVAQLLEGRLLSSLRQLESMRQRISDKQSKVLVTGDLNAGKSTFVNALLRKTAMPTDQQPCTTVFCEVLDAEQSNKGMEEVHVVRDGAHYELEDNDTYTVHNLDEIENLMMKMEDAESHLAPVIKCYCKDTRATQESLLRNGVVDISLIDAPGLNRDSLKTTALFARQEEIDVIVFCVSAENHFTLSAKEFLLNASNDKAHVFIVVNKFDQIKNKDRCRARVLEQIRHLSPRTYEDAESLVHFVDSQAAAMEGAPEMATSFAHLEAALCDFVLTKRNKSKLLPAQTYLLNLLIDVDFLARTNLAVARREIAEAKEVLAVARPALKKVQSDARKLENQLENEEDGVVGGIVDSAKAVVAKAVDTLATGKLASNDVSMPDYPGFFGLWEYAYQVRVAMLESMERAVCNVEDAARQCTKEAVERIRNMGTERLPQDVEKPVFVSRPEAMFAKRRAHRTTAAAGLGLGPEMIEVRISDLFDAKHHLLVITGSTEEDNAKKDHEEEMSLVNSFSLGLGALTIVGGKTLGAKTAVEAFVRVSDLIGNPTVRRWAMPVFLLASTGMIAWTIIDLPNSVPRNVGRSLAKELKALNAPVDAAQNARQQAPEQEKNATTVAPSGKNAVSVAPLYTFAEIQSRRIGRETRKVIRLAGYDVNERFRVAIAARKQQVAQQEEKERKAGVARDYFDGTRTNVSAVRTQLQGLSGWEH